MVVRCLLFTLRILPGGLAFAVARVYVGLLDLLVPKLRRTGMKNVQEIARLPEPEAIIDGVFRNIARSLTVFAKLPDYNAENISNLIRYEGLEHFQEAKRRGKGAFFATAHMGNWELSAYGHGLMTEPMNVVVRPLDNRAIDEFVEARRAAGGNRGDRQERCRAAHSQGAEE